MKSRTIVKRLALFYLGLYALLFLLSLAGPAPAWKKGLLHVLLNGAILAGIFQGTLILVNGPRGRINRWLFGRSPENL